MRSRAGDFKLHYDGKRDGGPTDEYGEAVPGDASSVFTLSRLKDIFQISSRSRSMR